MAREIYHVWFKVDSDNEMKNEFYETESGAKAASIQLNMIAKRLGIKFSRGPYVAPVKVNSESELAK